MTWRDKLALALSAGLLVYVAFARFIGPHHVAVILP